MAFLHPATPAGERAFGLVKGCNWRRGFPGKTRKWMKFNRACSSPSRCLLAFNFCWLLVSTSLRRESLSRHPDANDAWDLVPSPAAPEGSRSRTGRALVPGETSAPRAWLSARLEECKHTWTGGWGFRRPWLQYNSPVSLRMSRDG
ncbi:uncharacterized protein WM294_004063 [Sarcoramphus papa]